MYSIRTLCGIFLLVCIIHCGESGKENVVKITDSNWSQTLKGEWLIKFYAPWCPACKSLAPAWKELSDWSKELDTQIAEVDVTEEPGLSGRFAVTSLPTIFHVTDGAFRRYMGPRSKDDFITLIEERKYEEIEPVPWWQSPSSIPMSILSWIFKISMLVRVTHIILTEEYGFPAWSSYGFFAVVTVMIGLLLGMFLVLIADFFFPVKPPKIPEGSLPPPTQKEVGGTKGKKKEEEDEEEAGSLDDAGAEEKRGDQTVRKRKTDTDGASL